MREDASQIQARCSDLMKQLHRLDPDESLQQLRGAAEQLMQLLCDMDTTDPASHVQLVEAVAEVQAQLQRNTAGQSKFFSLVKQLCGVVEEMSQLMATQQSRLDDYKILSMYRDYVAMFRARMVFSIAQELEGISSWDVLAVYLHEEQQLPDEHQITTNTVKTLLGSAGLTWSDWCCLREVADASNKIMHTGDTTPKGLEEALESLRSGHMPSGLGHTRDSLRKAIKYLKDVRLPLPPPRKKTAPKP